MVGPGATPPQLVCRGSLTGQVALVASVTLGQGPAAQAARQSGWVGCTWRCGPEEDWRGLENVHGEWYTVCLPVALRGPREP